MSRPDINSSVREIEDYEPKNFIDAYSWNSLKAKLLRKKNSPFYILYLWKHRLEKRFDN